MTIKSNIFDYFSYNFQSYNLYKSNWNLNETIDEIKRKGKHFIIIH